MLSIAEEFRCKRYAVLRGLVPISDCDALSRYALLLAETGLLKADDTITEAGGRYADPQMELLLADLLPVIEESTGLTLYPTYSYFRAYRQGSELRRHRDRPSCEVSMSVCLDYEASETWGLWVEGPAGVYRADLEPGDALLYRGCECLHWREPFSGECAVQVFLHYVERQGPNSSYRFDRRDELNLPPYSIRGTRPKEVTH